MHFAFFAPNFLHFFLFLPPLSCPTSTIISLCSSCMWVADPKPRGLCRCGFSLGFPVFNLCFVLLGASSCIHGMSVPTFSAFVWGMFPVFHISVIVSSVFGYRCRTAFVESLSPESGHPRYWFATGQCVCFVHAVVHVHFDCTQLSGISFFCVGVRNFPWKCGHARRATPHPFVVARVRPLRCSGMHPSSSSVLLVQPLTVFSLPWECRPVPSMAMPRDFGFSNWVGGGAWRHGALSMPLLGLPATMGGASQSGMLFMCGSNMCPLYFRVLGMALALCHACLLALRCHCLPICRRPLTPVSIPVGEYQVPSLLRCSW